MMKRENIRRRTIIGATIILIVILFILLMKSNNNNTDDFEMGMVLENNPSRFADITAGNVAEHSVSATLYDSNQYGNGGQGIKLDSSGTVVVDGWESDTSKFLQIDVLVNAYAGEQHVVKIQLPKELYVVGNITDISGAYTKVDFKKNADISVNGNGVYSVNKKSGTLLYYLAPGMERGSIQLELRYDSVLWDKAKNSPISTVATGKKDIDVSVVHATNLNVPLASVNLAEVRSGISLAVNTFCRYKKDDANSMDYLDHFTDYKDKGIKMKYEFDTLIFKEKQFYYKEEIIEINFPYYTDSSGVKHYIGYDYNSLELFNYVGGNRTFDVVEKTPSKLKISMKDSLFNSDDKFMLTLSYPSSLNTSDLKVPFAGGNVNITFLSNNGRDRLSKSCPFHKITYFTKKVALVEDFKDSGPSKNTPINYMVKDRPKDAISMLGQFNIRNAGSAASTPREIELNLDKGILVTSANLPMDTITPKVDITYTLVDDKGEKVYLNENGDRVYELGEGVSSKWTYTLKNTRLGAIQLDNNYTIFKRSMLPEGHKKYYLGYIKYTINRIEAGSNLFAEEAADSLISAGNYFGRLADSISIASEKLLISSVTVTAPDGSAEPIQTGNFITRVDQIESSYMVENVSFSENSIEAGESVFLQADVTQIPYYYTNCGWLRDVRLAIALPQGVSVNENNVSVRYTKNKKRVNIQQISTKPIENGRTLWIIDIDPDACVGYATEEGTSIANGASLTLNVEIETDKNMDTTTLFSDNIIYAASKTLNNVVYGSYYWARGTDKWDLDEDGSKIDFIAQMDPEDRVTCNISPNNPSLDITDKIAVNGSYSSNNSVVLNDKGDIVTYSLNIKCADEASASSFDYYIPVPRVDSGRDTYLVTGYSEDAYNFELTGPANLSGDSIYTFMYTTEPGLVYTDVRTLNSSKWYTESEMVANGIKWSDVTMVKLVVGSGKISGGMNSTITLNMKFADMNIKPEVGLRNAWKSSGYYVYDTGTRVISGHFRSKGCVAVINFTEDSTSEPTPTPTPEPTPTPTVAPTIVPTPVPSSADIVILNGEEYIDNVLKQKKKCFYAYDNLFNELIMPEKIEFCVRDTSGATTANVVISTSSDRKDKESYIDTQNISIFNASGEVGCDENGIYVLDIDKEYTLTISGSFLYNYMPYGRGYVYVHIMS